MAIRMSLPWGLIVFGVGIVYGWLTPGRQDKMRLMKTGVLIGLALAVVFSILGYVLDANPLGFGTGFLAILLGAVVLTLLFVLGVWVGDLIEGTRRKRTA